MEKPRKVLTETTDNRAYNAAVAEITKHCHICKAHRGCNRNRDNYNDSWKNYRKNQWRD